MAQTLNGHDHENEHNRLESDSLPATLNDMKHPLEHQWTLWYYETDRSKSWGSNLKEVKSFDTIEDFWCVYNHIVLPTQLRSGSDYAIFKSGIKPMWEDDRNKDGGRWLINVEKRHRFDLSEYWLHICLKLIGETLTYAHEVNGAVVNVRSKGDKLAVWTATAMNADAILDIGRQIKDTLQFKDLIHYEAHKDTSQKSGSTSKYLYTV